MITWDNVSDLEQDFRAAEPEETAAEARARMLPAEIEQDDAYRALAERRSQPLKNPQGAVRLQATGECGVGQRPTK